MAVLDTHEPNSPGWWFVNLSERLNLSLEGFKEDLDYASGNHPLPSADTRYVKALQEIQARARSNYFGMVTKAPIERMRFKGIRFGETGKADEDAKAVWNYNDFDYQFQYLLMHAAVFGRSYIFVAPPTDEDDEDFPVITYEDPRMAITAQDPLRPTRALVGLRLWIDDATETVRAHLTMPDTDHWYQGPSVPDFNRLCQEHIGNFGAVIEGEFTETSVTPNELGEPRLVLVEWSPGGNSQAYDLKDVQDRINSTLLHRLVITQNQAFRQRWVSGMKPSKKENKGPKFDPGADMLWVTDNEKAKFGDFAQADIRQVLEAIRDDISDMAALSKTPVHYLMGRLANVSGDTLSQGESGFTSMIKMRMASVGWGIEKAMKLCFKYMGDDDKAKDTTCEVIWADPEHRTRAELADASVKEAAMFSTAPPFALPLLMKRAGYDPDEIEFAQAEAEKWQKEQQAREDKMLQQQHENQMAIGEQQGKNQEKLAEKQAAAGAKNQAATPKKKSTGSTSKSPGGK